MKKVMIVDDNALAAEGIEKNIRWDELDAQVSIIQYNSRSALEAMKEIPVDLIISDIEMPDLDGISMSKLALSINPQVKIILVSAYDKFEYAKRAIRLGVFDYIEKPLDYGYLTEKIKNAFIQLDKTRKNMELIQASRPLMTEKFFSDILHYPGEDASSHLGRFLEYLDLDFQYDYYTVLILEPEYTGEEKEKPDFAQFQLELLNILDLMKEHFQTFSNVYYLKEFESIIAIIGENSSSDRRFFQAVHNKQQLRPPLFPGSPQCCVRGYRGLQKLPVLSEYGDRQDHRESLGASRFLCQRLPCPAIPLLLSP